MRYPCLPSLPPPPPILMLCNAESQKRLVFSCIAAGEPRICILSHETRVWRPCNTNKRVAQTREDNADMVERYDIIDEVGKKKRKSWMRAWDRDGNHMFEHKQTSTWELKVWNFSQRKSNYIQSSAAFVMPWDANNTDVSFLSCISDSRYTILQDEYCDPRYTLLVGVSLDVFMSILDRDVPSKC